MYPRQQWWWITSVSRCGQSSWSSNNDWLLCLVLWRMCVEKKNENTIKTKPWRERPRQHKTESADYTSSAFMEHSKFVLTKAQVIISLSVLLSARSRHGHYRSFTCSAPLYYHGKLEMKLGCRGSKLGPTAGRNKYPCVYQRCLVLSRQTSHSRCTQHLTLQYVQFKPWQPMSWTFNLNVSLIAGPPHSFYVFL